MLYIKNIIFINKYLRYFCNYLFFVVFVIIFIPLKSKAIEDNWFKNGISFLETNQYDKAIKTFSIAIELNSNDYEAYTLRAAAWLKKKYYDKALIDLNISLKIEPNQDKALLTKAIAHFYSGNYNEAFIDLMKAMIINPCSGDIYNEFSWLSLICPDIEYRNGHYAIEMALIACKFHPNRADYLKTLAAAYAELGLFDLAIKTQLKAISFLKNYYNSYSLKLEQNLFLYRQKKPISYNFIRTRNSLKTTKKPGIKIPLIINSFYNKKVCNKSKSDYPYTIHLSSYQTLNKALSKAIDIYDNGEPIYISLENINKKENALIFYGYYSSTKDASISVEKLKKRHFKMKSIVKRPYVIELDNYDFFKNYKNMKDSLIAKKYLPYILLDKNCSCKTRLILGAFKSEQNAMPMLKKLVKDNFNPKLKLR